MYSWLKGGSRVGEEGETRECGDEEAIVNDTMTLSAYRIILCVFTVNLLVVSHAVAEAVPAMHEAKRKTFIVEERRKSCDGVGERGGEEEVSKRNMAARDMSILTLCGRARGTGEAARREKRGGCGWD
jgi:hypothetical protein